MNISENVSMSSQIIVKNAQNMDVQVAYLSAGLTTSNKSFNINCNIQDEALATANADIVKAQYAEFEAAVKARAVELGYVIF